MVTMPILPMTSELQVIVVLHGEPVIFGVPVEHEPTLEDVRRAMYRFARSLDGLRAGVRARLQPVKVETAAASNGHAPSLRRRGELFGMNN